MEIEIFSSAHDQKSDLKNRGNQWLKENPNIDVDEVLQSESRGGYNESMGSYNSSFTITIFFHRK